MISVYLLLDCTYVSSFMSVRVRPPYAFPLADVCVVICGLLSIILDRWIFVRQRIYTAFAK